MNRAWLRVIALGSVASATAGCLVSAEDVGQSEEDILFGGFSRQSYSEASTQHQEWATAVGVLVQREDVTYLGAACADPATGSTNDCTVELKSLTAAENVALGRTPLCAHGVNANIDPNDEQMRGACTAFMIAQDTFVTAGHCVFPDGAPFTDAEKALECSKRSVVLRWRPSDNAQYPNGNPFVLERHVYQCTDVLAHGRMVNGWLVPPAESGQNNDWAIFTVDRDVSGGAGTGGPLTNAREPLQLSISAPTAGTEGLTIGHPYGQPTKIDPEVSVFASPTTTNGNGTFKFEGDGNQGLSGAPLLDEAGVVLGLISAGAPFVEEADPRFPGKKCNMECYADTDGRTPVCPGEPGDMEPYAVSSNCVAHDTPGDDTFCTAECPCNEGMGDCDSATQCAPGLTCRFDIGAGYRLGPKSDVCVASACGTRALGSDSYCNDGCTCGYGSGDCDVPEGVPTCMEGMVCASNYGPAFKMKPATDICTLPQCKGRTLGAAGFCTDECPCGHGGGDCNDDNDCMPDLECADNVGEAFNAGTSVDICMPSTCAGRVLGTDTEYCTPGCPCGHGGGDCEENADCMPGHTCVQNNGASFGFPSNWDVCVRQ